MSATSNYRVNLQFDADTSAARSKISELQSLLTKVSAGTGTNSMATGLQEASAAAQELQIHLTNAFNVKTGKLDLSLLNKSLKSSGDSISNLTSKLLAAGKTGQDAFLGVAQAIASADQPMFQISQKLKDFSKTMQNTVKWQISSSIVHGFMRSISQAYNYTKDLNESLNNIRIVTGYNTDQMAKFAMQANKAAKALSTTTTNYTDSSLVYYQQGLTDEEVAARTNVTVKMANAAGESAKTVSQQLTAVWNNFYDGSKSLEYYADVMTALGAATASSTNEISEGLNKFAAAAETVGLSYEYATAALATVTATTRESADVVGTSFKTLFSRLQDLELGKTLDDGTSLGSYSQALAKVGINIKTTSGELKDMDQILDEMGSKWDTLSKAQQTALAQAAAGTRQYTQLVALMNNYDYFKRNLEVARNSEGTLQKQADIYAESWEAAEKRVKASMQGLYQSLLDDKFFIDLNNGFATVLNGFNDFIDKAGGMKTVLTAISGILMQMYAKEMPSMLSNLRNNLEFMTGHADKAYNRIMEDMKEASAQAKAQMGVDDDSIYGLQIDQANVLLGLKNKLALASDKMSEADKAASQIQLSIIKAQQDEIVERKKKLNTMQEELKLSEQLVEADRDNINAAVEDAYTDSDANRLSRYGDLVKKDRDIDVDINDLQIKQDKMTRPNSKGKISPTSGASQVIWEETEKALEQAKQLAAELDNIQKFYDEFEDSYADTSKQIDTSLYNSINEIMNKVINDDSEEQIINFGDDFTSALDKIKNKIDELGAENLTDNWITELQGSFEDLNQLIPEVIRRTTGVGAAFNKMIEAVDANDTEAVNKAFEELKDSVSNCKIESKDFVKVLKGVKIPVNQLIKYRNELTKMGKDTSELDELITNLQNNINNFKPNQAPLIKTSTMLTDLGSSVMTAYSAFNSLKGILETLSDPDISGWEKFGAALSGLAFAIPQIISGFQGVSTAIGYFTKMSQTAITLENNRQLVLQSTSLILNVLTATLGKANIQKALDIALTEKSSATSSKNAIAKIKERLANELNVTGIKGSIAARLLHITTINAEKGAVIGLSTALKIGLPILTAIVGIITLLVWAVPKIINAIKEANVDQLNKDIENTNKALEEATNNLDSINEKAKEVKSTFEKYNTLENDLSKLTRGTAEWNEKLQETNKKVKELMDMYPELIGASMNGEEAFGFDPLTGLMNVGSWVPQYATEKSAYEIQNASLSEAYLNQRSIELENTKNIKDFENKVSNKIFSNLSDTLYQIGAITSISDTEKEGYQFQSSKQIYTEQQVKDIFNSFKGGLKQINFDLVKYLNNEYSKEELEGIKSELSENVREGTGTEKDVSETRNLIDNYFKALEINSKGLENLNLKILNAAEQINKTFQNVAEQNLSQYSIFNSLSSLQTQAATTMTGQRLQNEMEDISIGLNAQSITKGTLIPERLDTISYLKQIADLIGYSGYNEQGGNYLNEVFTGWNSNEDWSYNLEKSGFGQALLNDYFQNQGITPEKLTYQGNTITVAKGYNTSTGEEITDKSFNITALINSYISKIVNNNGEIYEQILKQASQMDDTIAAGLIGNFSSISPEKIAEISSGEGKNREFTDSYKQQLIDAYNQATNNEIGQEGTLEEQWEKLTELIPEAEASLKEWNEESYRAAELAKKQAEAEQLIQQAATELGVDEKILKNYAKTLKTVHEDLNEVSAAQLAIANVSFNKGIEDLTKNWEDNYKVLKKVSDSNGKVDKSSWEVAESATAVGKALKQMFGVDVTNDFILEHLEDINTAANGDIDAINRLGVAAAKDYVVNTVVNSTAQTQLNGIIDSLSAIDPSITIDTQLSGDYVKQLNQMLEKSQVTKDQLQNIFNAIGWSPDIEMTDVPGKPITTTFQADIKGNLFGKEFQAGSLSGAFTQDQTISVPQIKTNGENNVKLHSINRRSNTASKPSSGGGGSSKKAQTVKQSDVVDRYKEVTDKLDLNTKAMDRASKAADRLYGADRLKKMDEVNKRLQTEISLQQRKAKEAEAYLAQDKQSLLDAASAAGISLAFDKDGTISNYTAVMNSLWNQLNNEITAANADGNADDTEQARIDAIQEKIDNLKNAISQYDDTRGVLQDIIDAQQEAINQIQDNNADILNTKLELRIEINENDLKKIEYELSKIEDNAFKAAEAMALTASQRGSYLDELVAYQSSYADLQEQYAKGNISQADYIEGLKTASDGIYDQLTNLNELKENMSEYYGDVIDKANEEIAKYTDRLDHLNDVLDHYVDLMDLLGKSKDYKALGELYAGQAKILKDNLETAQATYNMYADEAAEKKAQYERYLAEGDAAQAEYYKKQWQTAQNAANEAQSDLLEKTQAWAEAEKKVIENSLSALGRSLEETLTGGTSFDELTTAMDRAESLQEEYLTTTNKIYETNKLMRKAQQEIDKTTNSVAKRRLADFIAETDSLQNKNKLSEYELKIQQAKYDLLLAEIALEEAQNAKSTVRLQRDAEGNFGYVYTADADKISQAEQDLEDKQNDLYNIALEGANNYSKKYAETLQEMYDTLSELQTQYLEGEITSQEEYERKVAAAQEYYYQLLKDYSSLYQVAITTDNRVVADAWSTSFSEMIDQTDEWQAAVGNYLEQCAENLKTWQETVAEVMKNTGLNDVANKVSDITKESDELKKALLGDGENEGVIDALDKQFDSIAKLIEQWADYLPTLDGQIKKYEELAAAIRDIIKAENERVAQETEYTDATGSGNGGANNTSGTGTVDVSGVTGSGSGSGEGVYGSDIPTADNEDTKKIKLVQGIIGVTRDGIWGPASKQACLEKLGTSNWMIAYNKLLKSGIIFDGDVPKTGGRGPSNTNYTHFASGGYTGEWGSYGKLAVLHEKELVLNKADTSNLLASVDLLDHILQTLDLQTASTQFASRLTSAGFNSYAHDALEQNVHIEANFPNVSDRNEIEEAFNNIINRASQYANRK